MRTVRIHGLQSTVAVWYLGSTPNCCLSATPEQRNPDDKTLGLEWTNYARLASWVTVDVDLAFTQARFMDGEPVGTEIPGVLDRVISAGVTVEPRRFVFGSLRVRHFGPRPLIEDGCVNWKSTTI